MSEEKRFSELSPKTQDFLANLRPDEVDRLNYGIRLTGAILTVGTFFKWVIVGLIGLFAGVVMFGESIAKIASWFRQ